MYVDLMKLEPHVPTTRLGDKIVLFHGLKETWKTSVATSAPGHFIFGFEVGWNMIPGAMAAPIPTWQAFRALKKQFLTNPGLKDKYQTIVIDTVDKMYKCMYDHILKQHGISDPSESAWGKAWRELRSEFENSLLELTKIGYGIIMIDHTDKTTDEETGKISCSLAVDKKEREYVAGLCDLILYVNKELKDELKGEPNAAELVADKRNLQVYAYSYLNTPHIWAETKTRGMHMKQRFPFSYDQIEKEIGEAVKKYSNQTNTNYTDDLVDIRKTSERMPYIELKNKMMALGGQLMQDEAKQKALEAIIVRDFNVESASEVKFQNLSENDYDRVLIFYNDMLELSA